MFIFFQQRSCVSLPWTLMQNLKKNWSVVSKMTRSWSILTWALESLKNLHFFCYCAKYLMFGLKNYRGIIFHDTGGWCKIWRKMDLWFGKWHEEYGKFWPEHLKVWKLGPWWDPFAESIKCMSLKVTEDMHDNEELTCHFKIDIRNLINFDSNTWKSKKFALQLAPFTKVFNIWAKKSTEELCLMALKIDAKSEGNLTCAFKNDMRNLCKFVWNEINE